MVGVDRVEEHEQGLVAVFPDVFHGPVVQRDEGVFLGVHRIVEPPWVVGVDERLPVPVESGPDAFHFLLQHLEHRGEIPFLVSLDRVQLEVVESPVVGGDAVDFRAGSVEVARVVRKGDRWHDIPGRHGCGPGPDQHVDVRCPGLCQAVHPDPVESDDDHPFGNPAFASFPGTCEGFPSQRGKQRSGCQSGGKPFLAEISSCNSHCLSILFIMCAFHAGSDCRCAASLSGGLPLMVYRRDLPSDQGDQDGHQGGYYVEKAEWCVRQGRD